MTRVTLRRCEPGSLPPRTRPGLDADALATAADILADLRRRREPALREWATRLDGLVPDAPLWYEQPALAAALEVLPTAARQVLERLADRIASFATSQLRSLQALDVAVDGGRAGHHLIPMDCAGCYAPAGRFPLPSSLLMAAVTARVAGVSTVVVASPRPSPLMLATAAIAGVNGVLAAGGAQAIGALAEGIVAPRCDIVVGPGNRWVTAAKKLIAGETAIDFLAGPSELLVVADETASPAVVAADLLAQAEHDPDAQVALIVSTPALLAAVEAALTIQLAALPDPANASAAIASGMAVVCRTIEEVVTVCDAMAPEHLQLSVARPEALAARVRHAGAVFLGERSAEVFGDYGLGGNHVLPTAGIARQTGGLSALHFVRVRSWLRLDRPESLTGEVAAVARMEGLEAHARAAEARNATTATP
jgi:phosphoribosyl-ATP pyrophosphohydrolase/phosphoribosyl-AMP cyclohydrolase/histidinol dehydrogenase